MLKGSQTVDHLAHAEIEEEQGIDLVAVVAALLGEWKIALAVFVLVSVLGLAYVHSLKPQYVASASFLPTQGHTEADALASIFSARGPGALYIGLLRSRAVMDEIIDRNHLLQLFGTTSHETGRAILAGKTGFSEGADSIITITVRDKNAPDAAMMANAYLQGLQDLSNKMAQAQAAQTRQFFNRELQQQREELNVAQAALAAKQQKTGEVAPETQAALGISNIAGLRGQITGLQVQLSALLQGATEQNPQVQRLRSQIAALEAQERTQETGAAPTPVGAAPAAIRIPTIGLDLQAAQREVADRSSLVNSLTKQYESAQLDEQFSHTAFEVIDQAFAPETKAWPPKGPYTYACFGAGVVAALFAVVLRLLGRRVWADPNHRQALRRLREAF